MNVEPKGFEPLTSALSKQRSKPAELRFQFIVTNIERSIRFWESDRFENQTKASRKYFAV